MTAVICLGGPLHGRFADPRGQSTFRAAWPSKLPARMVSEAAEPVSPAMDRVAVYHLRSIEITGWRIVLNCLTTWEPGAPTPDGCVMPGYVHGVPAEREPNPHASEAVCRCAMANLIGTMRQMVGRGRSSCHLDHCPLHGPFRDRP